MYSFVCCVQNLQVLVEVMLKAMPTAACGAGVGHSALDVFPRPRKLTLEYHYLEVKKSC